MRSAASKGGVARVARNLEAKICARKECLLCQPRARYLNTCGYDHVELERGPAPTGGASDQTGDRASEGAVSRMMGGCRAVRG